MRFSIQQSVRLVLTLGLAASVAALDMNPTDTLKNLISKLHSNLQNAAMCGECTDAIAAAQLVADISDQTFVDAASDICKFEKVQPDVVCDDLAEIEGPIFANVIKSISSDGPEAVLLCAALGGLCPYPPVPNYDVTFPKIKPANAVAPPVSGRSKTLLHLSDIHVDPLYVVGLIKPKGLMLRNDVEVQAGTEAVDCNMPLCCRNYGNQTTPSNPASKWGDYSCDTPVELLDALLDSIPSIQPEIDWAIITGDIAPQDVWLASQMTVTTTLTAVYSAISKHFAANNVTKVFPTVGNHDTAPVNLFPLKSQSNANAWLYETLASSWKQWLPDDVITEVGDYGTYAVKPEPGFKIISLNTNLCYVDDFYIYAKVGELDPNDRVRGQETWGDDFLVTILADI
ncbi:Metallo-dependent phosphatase-like protein [Endogone sp. FLAS-F59071]|nr:Metallo-dependent phosphatase-like protein [Endogone sp. FLAS-F59071]|eukprot:RUS13114.1 Metallo-dependent phosphatase-like protein [Endogone sp. FLAS-F59071]